MANTIDFVGRGRALITQLIQVCDGLGNLQSEYVHMAYDTDSLALAFTAQTNSNNDMVQPAANGDITAVTFVNSLQAAWDTLGAMPSTVKDTIYKAKL